jgi:hypothetical protein
MRATGPAASSWRSAVPASLMGARILETLSGGWKKRLAPRGAPVM